MTIAIAGTRALQMDQRKGAVAWRGVVRPGPLQFARKVYRAPRQEAGSGCQRRQAGDPQLSQQTEHSPSLEKSSGKEMA